MKYTLDRWNVYDVSAHWDVHGVSCLDLRECGAAFDCEKLQIGKYWSCQTAIARNFLSHDRDVVSWLLFY
jgi:hypothetical protein